MNIHITSREGTRDRQPSKLAQRVKMHYHERSVKEYIDYVIDEMPSKKIAIVGKLNVH